MLLTSTGNITCLNCGATAEGRFCHECGQKTSTRRITYQESLEQFLSAYFSLEGPLLKTIGHLVLDPGNVFRSFISGKRKAYYQPISFFILLTAVYIILRVLISYDPFDGSTIGPAQGNNLDLKNNFELAARFMYGNINYIMFLIALTSGLMMKLFFSKEYNIAEYTSIGFYISGMYVIVTIIYMLASKIFNLHSSQIQPLILSGILFYCSYSLFKRTDFISNLKYISISVFSILLYMFLGFGLSFIIVSIIK